MDLMAPLYMNSVNLLEQLLDHLSYLKINNVYIMYVLQKCHKNIN